MVESLERVRLEAMNTKQILVKRVLIIDDETDICEIARMSLQLTNQWQVLIATSSQAGIAIATVEPLDAILLDVVMPDVDGLTTLKKLKNNPITDAIPVVMLTASLNTAAQHQYFQLGADAVIIKPFDPSTLGQQVMEALSWKVV
jgi:CheY-like chemotaxis protein